MQPQDYFRYLFTRDKTMNKRDYEDVEAEVSGDDTLGSSDDEYCSETDKGKEKVPDKTLPPKKRQRVEQPKKKKGKFRLAAKNLALTYSDCPATRQECYDQLVEKLGEPVEYAVAQEHHQVIIMTAQDYYNQYVQECLSKIL